MAAEHKPRSARWIRRIAFIGDYPPRQCGIAEFTSDLCESIAEQHPEIDCFAVSVTDVEEGYDYPPRVRFEIPEQSLASYRRAAEFLNANNVDRVCIQHEYGIYGGPRGSHLLALVRELRMPVVTTLHTVLGDPNARELEILEQLTQLSDRLVVLSAKGKEFLTDVYRVPEEKIDHIPHGIPDMPFVDPNFYKDQFGVEGRQVILTFGLLSRNKGIEYAIDALPDVVRRHPDVVYVVLGATHPRVVLHEGESYRRMLAERVRDLGLEEHVIFDDRFLSLEELIAYIGASDIYITPYVNREQISSGTLSYALGAGKALVSTPYWHAEELLADGRGRSVPFKNSAAIAQVINELLDNETERHAMRKRAYLYGREMIWRRVARRYMDALQQAWEERLRSPHPVAAVPPSQEMDLPPLRLDHLRRLTDDTGMFQHTVFSVPNYHEGYATDDNARALIAAVLMEALGEEDPGYRVRELATRYLAFLWYAFNPTQERFRNFLGYDRRWHEEAGSEDSHGRTLWALGTVIGHSGRGGLRGTAIRLFDQALSAVTEFKSPRSWAFSLLGLNGYLQEFAGSRPALQTCKQLAEQLLRLYEENREPEWEWFEDVVTYDNAILPHALLVAGRYLKREDMTVAGLTSLEWLSDVQRAEEGHFVPIGNRGFYQRAHERARFDQQPIEAYSAVSASLAAYRLTGDEDWYEEAYRAFEWFLGRNDLSLPLYDPSSGGCHDGLQPDRVNENLGAESTLAFLLSLLELRVMDHDRRMQRAEARAPKPERSRGIR